MDATADGGCFICQKHLLGETAPGGVLYEDDVVYVGHIHPLDGPTAYSGWLVVEPKRHAPGLGDLTDEEAEAIGRLINRCARLLREHVGAEHVYAFVYGDGVPHLHVHVAPRYAGTPSAFWGPRLRQWADAPRVDEREMRELVGRLRRLLAAFRR